MIEIAGLAFCLIMGDVNQLGNNHVGMGMTTQCDFDSLEECVNAFERQVIVYDVIKYVHNRKAVDVYGGCFPKRTLPKFGFDYIKKINHDYRWKDR